MEGTAPRSRQRLRAPWRGGIVGESLQAMLGDLLLLGVWCAAPFVYPLLNHGPNRILLQTPLDEALPVVPVFVIPYVSLTILLAVSMVLFLIIRSQVFRSAACSMLLVWAVAYGIYFVLQSYIVRPTIPGNDIFSTMVRNVYAGDGAYNDFPSLHVALSTAVAYHWLRLDRRFGAVVAAWVVLIVASTVLIHQHYLADVAGGLALSLGSCHVCWGWFNRDRRRDAQPSPAV